MVFKKNSVSLCKNKFKFLILGLYEDVSETDRIAESVPGKNVVILKEMQN